MYNTLSMFSGAMGLDLGLEKAGLHIKLALEYDRDACMTIRANRPGIPLIEGDIRDYSADPKGYADILHSYNNKYLSLSQWDPFLSLSSPALLYQHCQLTLVPQFRQALKELQSPQAIRQE